MRVVYPPGRRQRTAETRDGVDFYQIGWRYDDLGRVAEEHIQTLSSEGWPGAAYEYDLLGRVTYLQPKQPNRQGVRTDYAGAFLKRICRTPFTRAGAACDESVVDDVRYDALGRRATLLLPPGQRRYQYDSERRIARDEFTPAAGSASSAPIAIAYTSYDALGNVTGWTTSGALAADTWTDASVPPLYA